MEPRLEVALFCLPQQLNGRSLLRITALLLGSLLFTEAPAGAQITSYVDENGRKIYVNFEPPVKQTAARAGAANSSRTAARTPAAGAAASNRLTVRTREDLERIVQAAASRHRVDPVLVRAVIQAESGWNPEAVSRKGAQGLMQLMPATAAEHGVDAFDPEQNVNTGAKILRRLLEKYNGDLDRALAAYNAGEGAVARHKGVPNYPETRAYVQKVTDTYFQPGSGRAEKAFDAKRPIYKTVDARGRVIYTNE